MELVAKPFGMKNKAWNVTFSVPIAGQMANEVTCS